MVDEYTKNAEKAGLSGKLRAVREELKGNGTELDGAKFDVITVRSALSFSADCCAYICHSAQWLTTTSTIPLE